MSGSGVDGVEWRLGIVVAGEDRGHYWEYGAWATNGTQARWAVVGGKLAKGAAIG